MGDLPHGKISRITMNVGAGRPRPKLTTQEMEVAKRDQEDKSKYKIEVMFGKQRSSLAYRPSPCALIIWESGRRLHGGGDQKMYWCGYPDCAKPLSSDNFGYMHAVCPICKREQFLDLDAKQAHIRSLKKENRRSDGIERLPIVVGEKYVNLTPPNLAELIVKTWYELNMEADVYLKYSPNEIRYDPKNESTKTIDNLDKVRVQRQPLIYALRAIRKDLAAGADLKAMITGMITA